MTEDIQQNEGSPLLDWVLQRYPDTPKSRAKEWIVAGRVRVHGVVLRRPHERLRDPGDALELLGRAARTLDCGGGWRIHPRLELLHLDPSLAVVNKGPGLLSVPGPSGDISALSLLDDFLSGRLRVQDRERAGRTLPPVYRRLHPLPVHRLDQYTSGVFCMALNPRARGHLIEQLKTHTMRREYVAFAEGRPTPAKGTWRQWLALCDDELTQHVVSSPQGKTSESKARMAITHYETVAEFTLPDGAVISKLRLQLETGLKHQIRVQAANAGLPLIGDRTYNRKYRGPNQTGVPIPFSRQALHAVRLEMEHPEAPGKRVSWTAEFPKDWRELERSLSAKRG